MKLLNVKDPDAPGYCSFSTLALDQEFYDSLTAEEMQSTTDRRGYPKIEWTKLRPNEAWDLFATITQWQCYRVFSIPEVMTC